MSGVQNNITVPISGGTATLATQNVSDVHYPYVKLGYGASGGVTLVSDANGLPVRITSGVTATFSSTGYINVRGDSAGGPVSVAGTVFVRSVTGTTLGVTGGRVSNKSSDSIAVYGAGGETYVPFSLYSSTGTAAGFSGDQLKVWVDGLSGVSFTIPTSITVTGPASAPAFVQGSTYSYPLAITGVSGNYIGITNPEMLSGLTAIYNQVVGLRSDLAASGAAAPTAAYQYTTTLSAAVTATFTSGFTCQKGVSIKAHATNTALVWVGGVTTSSLIDIGFPLDPGEQTFMWINNINKIAFTSSSSGQKVSILAT